MTIESCCSCNSTSVYTQAARERQNTNRSNDIASEQALIQEWQRTQEYFQPDPSRFLDIQA